jgi:hypothetical protein
MLAGAVLVTAIPAVALPLGGPLYGSAEKWDDYATGFYDPNYVANWYVPPGMYRIMIRDKRPWSPPNALWIVDTEGYGIAYDLLPDLQAIAPLATGVNGTDDNPLIQQFEIWMKGCPYRKYASCFIQLAMGDQMVPDVGYAGPVVPVIAMGWIRGLNYPGSITPWYFDGQVWHSLGSTDATCAYNILKTVIKTDSVAIDNLLDAGYPPQIRPRAYLGSFDTIMVRSPNNDAKERAVDDIWLIDGVLTGPPIELDMDILPDDDPNNMVVTKSRSARLPIEVYGTEDTPGEDIDLDTVLVEGIQPVRAHNDIDYDGDGILDLKVHVNRRALIDELGLVGDDENNVPVAVELTANRVSDGWAIVATDGVLPRTTEWPE